MITWLTSGVATPGPARAIQLYARGITISSTEIAVHRNSSRYRRYGLAPWDRPLQAFSPPFIPPSTFFPFSPWHPCIWQTSLRLRKYYAASFSGFARTRPRGYACASNVQLYPLVYELGSVRGEKMSASRSSSAVVVPGSQLPKPTRINLRAASFQNFLGGGGDPQTPLGGVPTSHAILPLSMA